MDSGRNRGQEQRQLPLDVLFGPIGRLVVETEIDVVHLDLSKSAHGTFRRWPMIVAVQIGVRPPRRHTLGPDHLQPALRTVQVSKQLLHGPPHPIVDVGSSLPRSARVTSDILSMERPLEPAGVTVGMAGHMVQYVSDRPSRQAARRANLLICDLSTVASRRACEAWPSLIASAGSPASSLGTSHSLPRHSRRRHQGGAGLRGTVWPTGWSKGRKGSC